MMSVRWYDTAYRDYRKRRSVYPEPLRMKENVEYYVKFIEDEPKIVHFHGMKIPVIFVLHNGITYALWLSHKDLANKIASIQKEKGSLKDVEVKITKLAKSWSGWKYKVELLEPKDSLPSGGDVKD